MVRAERREDLGVSLWSLPPRVRRTQSAAESLCLRTDRQLNVRAEPKTVRARISNKDRDQLRLTMLSCKRLGYSLARGCEILIFDGLRGAGYLEYNRKSKTIEIIIIIVNNRNNNYNSKQSKVESRKQEQKRHRFCAPSRERHVEEAALTVTENE